MDTTASVRIIHIKLDIPDAPLPMSVCFVRVGEHLRSDALVAVRYATTGDGVTYDLAIELPVSLTAIAVRVGSNQLVREDKLSGAFRGMAPRILGWALRPELGVMNGVKITADDLNRGRDWCRETLTARRLVEISTSIPDYSSTTVRPSALAALLGLAPDASSDPVLVEPKAPKPIETVAPHIPIVTGIDAIDALPDDPAYTDDVRLDLVEGLISSAVLEIEMHADLSVEHRAIASANLLERNGYPDVALMTRETVGIPTGREDWLRAADSLFGLRRVCALARAGEDKQSRVELEAIQSAHSTEPALTGWLSLFVDRDDLAMEAWRGQLKPLEDRMLLNLESYGINAGRAEWRSRFLQWRHEVDRAVKPFGTHPDLEIRRMQADVIMTTLHRESLALLWGARAEEYREWLSALGVSPSCGGAGAPLPSDGRWPNDPWSDCRAH